MNCSYPLEDVTLLLKDITGLVQPLPTEEREKLIQSGRHYSEMLPLEYSPSTKYLEAYQQALQHFAEPTAEAVGRLAHKLQANRDKNLVLVSLARGGIPVGILLKRYLKWRFQWDVPHYSISIIRGRGIDKVAMKFLLEQYQPEQLLFVDGWVGKGAIFRELQQEISQFQGVSSDLAVLSDPSNITSLYGTQDDILIPSACLNSTVSGLISRTFLREDIIGAEDFHGAVYYKELEESDQSNAFLQEVEQYFQKDFQVVPPRLVGTGMEEVEEISREYNVDNLNFIKPGIGETTRVLLRRVPWKILVNPNEKENPCLSHILQLAKERAVPVEYREMKHYLCCGIIKQLSDI